MGVLKLFGFLLFDIRNVSGDSFVYQFRSTKTNTGRAGFDVLHGCGAQVQRVFILTRLLLRELLWSLSFHTFEHSKVLTLLIYYTLYAKGSYKRCREVKQDQGIVARKLGTRL
jgi:hypothetical protein